VHCTEEEGVFCPGWELSVTMHTLILKSVVERDLCQGGTSLAAIISLVHPPTFLGFLRRSSVVGRCWSCTHALHAESARAVGWPGQPPPKRQGLLLPTIEVAVKNFVQRSGRESTDRTAGRGRSIFHDYGVRAYGLRTLDP